MGVDQTNSAACVAGKGSVHCALAQHLTVDSVIGCGWDGADHVCWVNVFDVNILQIQAMLWVYVLHFTGLLLLCETHKIYCGLCCAQQCNYKGTGQLMSVSKLAYLTICNRTLHAVHVPRHAA